VKAKKVDGVVYKVYSKEAKVQGSVFIYHLNVYVDENGFIAKTEYYSEEEMSMTTRLFNYNFDDVDLSLFKVDKNKCGSVSKKFLEKPVMKTCKKLVIHDSSKDMCAFSVEATVAFAEQVYDTKLYFSDKDQLPLLAIEHSTQKEIYRGDLFFHTAEEPFVADFLGEDGKCIYQTAPYATLMEEIHIFLAAFLDDFYYTSEEAVDCGKEKCTKYCRDALRTNCVAISNSEPHRVVKYQSPELNITYGVPVEVTDMSVFTLDKSKFPGCEGYSKAYEKPRSVCSTSSSSSSVSSSSATSSATHTSSTASSTHTSSTASSTHTSSTASSTHTSSTAGSTTSSTTTSSTTTSSTAGSTTSSTTSTTHSVSSKISSACSVSVGAAAVILTVVVALL